MAALPLTRRSIFAQAWPIMIGQATVPLVGIVDTAVIGRTGDVAALAGVALGTTIINFLFWSFGFLRMGMTGMTAQAQGAGDAPEVNAMLARGLMIGAALGAALFALQLLLIPAAFAVLDGGAEVDAAAKAYVAARFFGAPAILAVYAVNGWLLGLGRTRAALALQIVANVANMVLSVFFVWELGLGPWGVGVATAIAEWLSLGFGLWLVAPHLRKVSGLLDRAALKRIVAVNADIMLRTVALLAMFTWFTNAGARLGAETLAAQQVLMQFVAVAAFVLDGFAFTAEARVGGAIGANSRPDLMRAIRLTSEFSLVSAAVFASLIALAGAPIIALLSTDAGVRSVAVGLLPYVALVPLVGVPAWMLDGIFIGATAGRALRNAAILATALYVATDYALRPFGAHGVWIGLLASYGYRALALGVQLPALLAKVGRDP